MRKHEMLTATTVLGLVLLVVHISSAAVPMAQRLPSDAGLFVTIPDITALKTRWPKTSLGQLVADRAFADFLEHVEETAVPFVSEVESKTGLTVKELLQIPTGEVGLALLLKVASEPAVVATMDFGDHQDAVDSLLDRLRDLAAKDGSRRRRVQEYGPDDIVVFEREAKELGGNKESKKASQFAYVLKDSTIAISNQPKALEVLLDRWDGTRNDSLADNEAYRYVVERCVTPDAAPAMIAFIDPIGLMTQFATMSAREGGGAKAAAMLTMLPTLGLDRLKGVGGAVEFATGDFDMVSRGLVYVEQPATGVLNAFRCPSVAQSPPRWVPSDATAYTTINWDFANAWKSIQATVDSFQGSGWLAARVDELSKTKPGPAVDLRKDVIEQLTGELHIVVANEEDSGIDDVPRVLITLGLNDAAAVEKTLTTITDVPGFPGARRKFLGHVLYDLPTGPAAGGGMHAVGFAVLNGHLMFATDVTLLEHVLREDPDRRTLADVDDYQDIARHFPATTSILSFQHQDAQVKPVYEMLRNEPVSETMGLDFGRLPPFESVKKYLRPAGSYAVPDRNGVFFVSFTLPMDSTAANSR